jgi:hypothetical protein
VLKVGLQLPMIETEAAAMARLALTMAHSQGQ